MGLRERGTFEEDTNVREWLCSGKRKVDPLQRISPGSRGHPRPARLGSVGFQVFNESCSMEVHKFGHLQLFFSMGIDASVAKWTMSQKKERLGWFLRLTNHTCSDKGF